jgi:hypothetical protein
MSKKRFSSMSNLEVVKKYLNGERPYVTVSYNISEKEKHRENGEKWTVDGKEYKMENGKTICITKTQGDIIREAIGNGLNCKQCGAQYKWVGKKDQKFLRRCGLCMDCLIDYETKLRILGIYPNYEIYKLASYELDSLKTLRSQFEEVIEYFTKTNGDIIKVAESEYDPNIVWKNTNKTKILADSKKDLFEVNKRIDALVQIRDECKEKYIASATKCGLEILCHPDKSLIKS